MASNREELSFGAKDDGVTDVMRDITMGFVTMAKEQELFIKGSSQLSKATGNYKQFEGSVISLTDAGAKLVQRFKISRAAQKQMEAGTLTLTEAIKLGTTSIRLDTRASEARSKALAEQTRKTAELAAEQTRQQSNQGVTSQFLGQRAAVRSAGQTTTAPTSIAEESAFASAQDALKRIVAASSATRGQLAAVFDGVSKRVKGVTAALIDHGVELNKVRDAALKVVAAENKLGADAEKALRKVSSSASKAEPELEKVDTLFTRLRRSAKALATTAGISLFIGSVFRLQQALETATTTSKDLSIRIAEIETIQGEATFSTAQWSDELVKLSNSFGLGVLDQAEGAYQTLSSQVAKGTDTIDLLNAANKLAAAGVTNVGSAVKLTTSVLNAYGKESSEAADLSGKLFRAVELGVFRIEELEQTLGRVAVPAAAIGIRFEEIAALLALMTRQGVKSNEALTLIRGIIQKLISPTEEMTKVLNSMGFATSEAAIQTLGFGDLVGQLNKRTQGSTAEIGKLFNRVRAITGALIISGEKLKDFNSTLAAIDTSGVETLDKASGKVLDALGKRFDKLKNTIINVFIQDVGPAVLKFLISFAESSITAAKSMRDLVNAISSSKPALAVLTGTLTTLAVITIPTLITGLIGATKAIFGLAASAGTFLVATPLGAVALALGLVVAGYTLLSDSFEKTISPAEKFNRAIAAQTEELNALDLKLKDINLQEISNAFKLRNLGTRNSLATEILAINKANDLRLMSMKDLRTATSAVNKDILDNVKSQAAAAGSEFKKFGTVVEKTADDITKSFQSASKDLFQFDISVAFDQNKLRIIETQIAKLQNEQQSAAAAGDKASFDRLSTQIKELTKQRFASIEKVDAARQKADQSVFKARAELLRAQAKGNKGQIQAAKDRVEDAENLARKVGTAGKDELDLQQKIIAKRRELARAPFRSAEASALAVELEALRKAQSDINSEASRQEEQRKTIIDSFQRERKLRLDLADELAAKAKVAFDEQIKQKLIVAEITALEKKRQEFNLKTLLKTGDADKIATGSTEQIKTLQRVSQLQAQLGASQQQRLSVEREIANIQLAAGDAVIKANNKAASIAIANAESEFAAKLKILKETAVAENELDKQRIINLTKLIKSDSRQLDFASSTEKVQVTPGAQAAKKNIDASVAEIRAAEERIKLRREQLETIKDSFDVELETIKKRAEAAKKEVSQRNTFSSILADINKGVSKLKTDISDFEFNKNLIRAEQSRIDPSLDTGIQRVAPVSATTTVLTGESTKLAMNAALSKRPIEVKTAELAATAGVAAKATAEAKLIADKAKADKASLEAQKKLDAQKSSGTGKLTGFAAQVAASDSKQTVSAFEQRKKDAEERAAQRARNDKFLFDRQKRLLDEAAKRQEAVDKLTGTGKTRSVDTVTQAQRQLDTAKEQLKADPNNRGLQDVVDRLTLALSENRSLGDADQTLAGLKQKQLTADRVAAGTTDLIGTDAKFTPLDANAPTKLLVDALNLNTSALNALRPLPGTTPSNPNARISANAFDASSGFNPVIKSQLQPPSPRIFETGQAEFAPIMVETTNNIEVLLDGSKIAGNVIKRVERAGRTGTTRIQTN